MDLIVMAAGDSKRFGKNKLYMSINGRPLYKHVEDIYKKVDGFEKKILVSKYTDILDYFAKNGYTPVYNDDSSLGQSHSIKLGLKNLDQNSTSAMFAVCDQPLLEPSTVKKLMEFHLSCDGSLSTLRYQTRLGNPCIFSAKWYDELLALMGDVGGKAVIRKHLDEILYMDICDENQLLDVDNLEAYYKVISFLQNGNTISKK